MGKISRRWVEKDIQILPSVVIKKMATYQATWNHLLNGDGVKEETGLKFDYSFLIESGLHVSSLEDAEKIFMDKVSHKMLFKTGGVYLIHLRLEPQLDRDGNPAMIIGERMAYTPFFVVQALIQVSA